MKFSKVLTLVPLLILAGCIKEIRIDPGHDEPAPPPKPVADLTTVPSMVRHSLSNVRTILSRVGLRLGRVTYVESTARPGTVLRQSPAAGSRVRPGTAVSLGIAKQSRLPAPRLISPRNGAVYNIYPRTMDLRWTSVAGARSYRVQIEFKTGGAWKPWKDQKGLTRTTLRTNFVGAQPGRWRVIAVDARGTHGIASPWHGFRHRR